MRNTRVTDDDMGYTFDMANIAYEQHRLASLNVHRCCDIFGLFLCVFNEKSTYLPIFLPTMVWLSSDFE